MGWWDDVTLFTTTDLEQQITGIFRGARLCVCVCGKRKQFLKVDGALMVSH